MKNLTKIFTLVLLLSLSVITHAQSKGTRAKTPLPKTNLQKTGSTAQQIAESGSINGNIYSNKLLGFSITLPEGWTLLSDDANQITLNAGREIISAAKTRQRKQEIEISISNTRILFQTMPFPLGSAGNSALIASGVEKIPPMMDLRTYVEHNKKLVLETKELKRDVYSQTLGGKAFSAFEVKWSQGEHDLEQIYFVTLRKGAAFFFVLTFGDDTYKKTASDTLKTLTFGK
jgi:hypothetical protein